jgi:transposase
MKVKHAALVQALTGQFDGHHGELARMLLDQYDALTGQIARLTARIEELIAAIPAARGMDADGATGPGAGEAPDAAVRSAIARLDQIPGIGRHGAQLILAEIGLDMSRFPTASHLASWAKLCPRTIQSGTRSRGGSTGKGNPYLKGCSARPRPPRPRPIPSSASATGASSSAAASSRPWSPSPVPSC